MFDVSFCFGLSLLQGWAYIEDAGTLVELVICRESEGGRVRVVVRWWVVLVGVLGAIEQCQLCAEIKDSSNSSLLKCPNLYLH